MKAEPREDGGACVGTRGSSARPVPGRDARSGWRCPGRRGGTALLQPRVTGAAALAPELRPLGDQPAPAGSRARDPLGAPASAPPGQPSARPAAQENRGLQGQRAPPGRGAPDNPAQPQLQAMLCSKRNLLALGFKRDDDVEPAIPTASSWQKS